MVERMELQADLSDADATVMIASIARAIELRDYRGVDEYTVAIAATPPKVLREITADATIGEWSRESARSLKQFQERIEARRALPADARRAALEEDIPSDDDLAEAVTNHQSYRDGQKIENRVWQLTRRSRRRVAAFAVVGAVLIGGGALWGVGETKADFGTTLEDEDYRFKGDQIAEGNYLTWDDHLLSGDQGTDWPVIGPVIEAVPGIPDLGSRERVVTTTDSVTTIDENIVLEGSYSAAEVSNPAAPNLELTGAEYNLARATAAELLEDVDPETFTADQLSVLSGLDR